MNLAVTGDGVRMPAYELAQIAPVEAAAPSLVERAQQAPAEAAPVQARPAEVAPVRPRRQGRN